MAPSPLVREWYMTRVRVTTVPSTAGNYHDAASLSLCSAGGPVPATQCQPDSAEPQLVPSRNRERRVASPGDGDRPSLALTGTHWHLALANSASESFPVT